MKKYPISKIADTIKDLEKQLKQEFTQALQTIGINTFERFKKRVRLGYGCVSMNSQQQKFKPLTQAYKKYRQKFKNLSPYTTPTKSNLHLTGDMINDLTVETGDDYILIKFLSASGKMKAHWVTINGRPFMNLSAAEINRVKKELKTILKNMFQIR